MTASRPDDATGRTAGPNRQPLRLCGQYPLNRGVVSDHIASIDEWFVHCDTLEEIFALAGGRLMSNAGSKVECDWDDDAFWIP